MQRAMPLKREVSIPYHGMSFHLPRASSLFSPPASTTEDNRPTSRHTSIPPANEAHTTVETLTDKCGPSLAQGTDTVCPQLESVSENSALEFRSREGEKEDVSEFITDNLAVSEVGSPRDEGQTLQSTSRPNQPSPGSPANPRPSRKSRISLAIQFKGVCSPPQPSHNNTNSTHTAAIKNMPSSQLLKPSDFVEPEPAANESLASFSQASMCEGSVTGEWSKTLKVKGDGGSSDVEGVLTQESEGERERESEAQVDSCTGSSCEYGGERGCEGESGDLCAAGDHGENGELCASGESSEGEVEGPRMGLSSAQLEKSISLHQRSIHRNRVDLRGLNRRMRKTEEMLVADLAEQCAQEDQDTFTYTITPERENEISRVMGLQLHLASFSLEKSFCDQPEELDASSIKHDKLMSMELKLEAEAVSLERELTVAKREAQLLQAKYETAMN